MFLYTIIEQKKEKVHEAESLELKVHREVKRALSN